MSWVKILDGELGVMLFLCVLGKVALHEKGQVDRVRVLWVIARGVRRSLVDCILF